MNDEIFMEYGEKDGKNVMNITRGKNSRAYTDVRMSSRLRLSRLVNKTKGWDVRTDGKRILAQKRQ